MVNMHKASESKDDQIARVREMTRDSAGTWDLSDNDRAALEGLLADRDALLAALKRAERYTHTTPELRAQINAAIAHAETR